MTVEIEYRLRCDFCGNRSPVLIGWPDAAPYPIVMGAPDGVILDAPGWIRAPAGVYTGHTLHFCCENHRAQWLAIGRNKATLTPPRPEPSKLQPNMGGRWEGGTYWTPSEPSAYKG